MRLPTIQFQYLEEGIENKFIVVPKSIYYESTKNQWLLKAFNVQKKVLQVFALDKIIGIQQNGGHH